MLFYKIDMARKKSGNFRIEKMTPSQRQEAIELVKSGTPKTKIAKQFGVSRTYIYQLLKPKVYKTC